MYAVQPDHLEPPNDIVGYPTFWDYDFQKPFVVYRLVVWGVPLITFTGYVFLRRWGPLSDPARPPRPGPLAFDLEPALDAGTAADPARSPWWWFPSVHTLPAALALGIGVATVLPDGPSLGERGVVAAIGYVVLIHLGGWILSRSQHVEPHIAIAGVNAIGSGLVGVLAATWFIDGATTVGQLGEERHWGWLPWWLGVLVGVAVVGWCVLRLRGSWAPARVEWHAAWVFAGAAIVLMTTARLPGSSSAIQGFDDMQSVTGADLMSRGFFPWRDFYFIHGLFEDVLRSTAGFFLYGHTLWGASAADAMLFTPLFFVGCYLLVQWLVPRHWMVALGTIAFLTWASRMPSTPRWFVIGFVFVLFGEALRRSDRGWTVLWTVVMFVTAVLVPEFSFVVLACSAVLILRETWERADGVNVGSGMRKVRVYVVTGVVCTAVWCAYLALNDAFVPFLTYYKIFAPDHADSGAQPLTLASTAPWRLYFAAIVLVVLAIFAVTAHRFLTRRSFSERDWLYLALAVFTALYGEKALGRFDDGHIGQVATASLPMMVAFVARVLVPVDRRIHAEFERLLAQRRAQPVAGGAPPWSRYLASALTVVALVAVLPLKSELWSSPSDNRSNVPNAFHATPLLGYTSGTFDVDLVNEMRTVTDALAGTDAPVFDFTNSPGYFYYLLGRVPATTYYHVSMAIPEFTQRDVVDQLKKSKPPVVIFDSTMMGLPTWDGPYNEARHFIISQYLLDHWTPVVRARGTLFMLRNDLLPGPVVPPLRYPAQTVDLYSQELPCDWGDVPNFLQSTPTGDSVRLTVGAPRPMRHVSAFGWAYDPSIKGPVSQVLLAVGDQVVASSATNLPRKDLITAIGTRGSNVAGFRVSGLTTDHGPVRVYAMTSDGDAHLLPGSPSEGRGPRELRLSGGAGATVEVGATHDAGRLDLVQRSRLHVSHVAVPAGTDLSSYDLASFGSERGSLGTSRISLVDSLAGLGANDTEIAFSTLPRTPGRVRVRVGSCLQWHGYSDTDLYLLQQGGNAIDSVVLSGVSDR